MRTDSNARPRWKVVGLLTLCLVMAGADGPKAVVGLDGVVVDAEGRPVAGALVRATRPEGVVPVRSGADGRFRVEVEASGTGRYFAGLLARGEDGRVGWASAQGEAGKAGPIEIVLKPAKAVEVRVVDAAGRPVEGAEVAFLSRFQPLFEGRTDAEGRRTIEVPADATPWLVHALKGKLGFDYATGERARGSTEPALPLPDRLTLTLDGARTPLRVRAVDPDGKPLAGVKFGPWLVSLPGREVEANLGGGSTTWVATGADGYATLDWLPARQVGMASISTHSEAFHPRDHSTWLPADKPVDEVAITLLPSERLSGRIITADGRAVEGAVVEVQGQGAGDNTFHAIARTDADGRYAFRAHAEQAYILTASKGELAAPYQGEVVLRAGKPLDGVDLTLGRGTRVRGRVGLGKDGSPVAGIYVNAVINLGQIPAELRRAGDRRSRAMTLSQYRETDADGRYEFLLGPGEYTLQGPPRVEPARIKLPVESTPPEVVRDFAMPRPDTGPFAATVVDPEGRPVAGAVLNGMYTTMESRGWFTTVKTNARGGISISRSLDPLMIHAETLDKALGALVRVDAEASEARIVLKLTATASARLVDPSGSPIPRQKLTYNIRVSLGTKPNSPFTYTFGGAATTDDQGRFHAPGLVVGEKYHVVVHHDDNSRMSGATTNLEPAAPGPMDAGDLAIDLSPPKPYVPPTAAQRTGEAFEARKEKSPRERIDSLLVEARREYTRPLILLGNAKDPACVELFRLFNDAGREDESKPKTPADLRWEFELASLDAGSADVAAFARDLGVPAVDTKTPTLAVLSADGKLDATHALRPGADGRLDPAPLAAFLLAHKRPTRDAEGMLADAMARAKAEDKRVFLILSASWCAPCRLLARFLDANKAELGRHYVFVKLDVSRDDRVAPLRARFKECQSAGVPWYVILDAAGNPLIHSNAKPPGDDSGGNPNVGFPSSKDGIAHFLKMLKSTAPRLDDEALATLRRGLGGKP